MESTPPPVEIGDIFKTTITAIGRKGDGISKLKGYTIFVPNTALNDEVTVKVTSVSDTFAFAQVVSE